MHCLLIPPIDSRANFGEFSRGCWPWKGLLDFHFVCTQVFQEMLFLNTSVSGQDWLNQRKVLIRIDYIYIIQIKVEVLWIMLHCHSWVFFRKNLNFHCPWEYKTICCSSLNFFSQFNWTSSGFLIWRNWKIEVSWTPRHVIDGWRLIKFD